VFSKTNKFNGGLQYMNSRKILAFMLALIMILGLVSGCNVQNNDDSKFDVIVVGGGAAGLSAAIEAAEAGAEVAIIEKMPVLGGSTLLSEGIVYATGSKIQTEYPVNDSTEALVNFWIDKAEGQNDVPSLQLVADQSGATIDWLVDLGVVFGEPVATGTSPVLRGHVAENKGAGIIDALKARAEKKKVTFILETRVTELITNESSEIVGLKAMDKAGQEVSYETKAVVLATGGFDKNEALVDSYAPVAKGQTTFSSESSTGDGLTMAIELGADVINKGGVFGTKTVIGEPAYKTEINQLLEMPLLAVNSKGERFVDESDDFAIYYQELVKQEGAVSYMIFDQTSYVATLDKAVENGSAFVADTLDELAAKAGIDPAGLSATVLYYNDMIKFEKDEQFGKNLKELTPLESPKYYALKVVPAILGTMSGLKTDLEARVLNADGVAISGLYAAGELATGNFYNTIYPAMGTSLQVSLTFGRIAGEGAAKFADK
jgi:fumarate reductase flavoprotein subunit